ncbi:MAG: hypothetical protein ABI277_02150 [Burkholderiaceae bacterium]
MTASTGLTITLEYQRIDASLWQRIELDAASYFDLEVGDVPSIRGLARHDHAIDYLAVEASQLQATRLTIVDSALAAERIVTETFWNGGRSRAIERVDSGDDPYWELILDFQPNIASPNREIVRLGRKDGVLIPYYHGYFQKNVDGTYPEIQLNVK